MDSSKPTPELDPINSEFFESLGSGKLLLQKCSKCGHLQFYPRPLCVKCSSVKMAWQESSGNGNIYSLTEIKRVIMNSKEFDNEVPYFIASVELEEGVRIYGRIEAGKHEPKIGDKVVLSPIKDRNNLGYPAFRPA